MVVENEFVAKVGATRRFMKKDDAEILKVFQFELRFLEDGNYGRSPRAPWRASYVF
jgi:hypothetical protein